MKRRVTDQKPEIIPPKVKVAITCYFVVVMVSIVMVLSNWEAWQKVFN